MFFDLAHNIFSFQIKIVAIYGKLMFSMKKIGDVVGFTFTYFQWGSVLIVRFSK